MNAYDNLIYIYNSIRPIIDIAVLAFLLYKAYDIVIKTQGIQIIRAIIIISCIYLVAILLNLKTILWILSIIAPGILVGFAVIFQPELRKIILRIGQKDWLNMDKKKEAISSIDAVLSSAVELSKIKRGMLVVFTRNTPLKDYATDGTPLNADLSSSLLTTIFKHDSPLHDGATIIQGGKILLAGCYLPLSGQYDIKKIFGTRHRAALGLAEVTDAIILTVSEETGAISLAYDSKLHYDLTEEQIVEILNKELPIDEKKPLTGDTRNDE